MLPLESSYPTLVTLSDPNPHGIVLPTNQVPWKIYYRRNLRKEVESPVVQTALVQDFEPIRDQGMIDSINSYSNNRMSENDMGEQVSIDEAIVDREDRIIENEVVAENTENETKSNHYGNSSRYDPSLDLLIALRKGTRSCTKHSICNYVSYENLSPQFRAFTASLDSTTIPKNIHSALKCPEWKNVVMEEM